ncbi:MAG TPA: heme lyase CcmF/NrfE family subunit [Candidatus Tectomicrobia bacterium]|nr:heme lyase CcmF/NrfE family subunit [Candidatus Tectomicrobia bacterium]
MISQLGSLLLMVSLAVAVYGIAAAALGAHFKRWEFVSSAYRAVLWMFGLVTVAGLLLVTALITYDFSIAYVARNTLRGTPLYYRVTALWGSLEGSLLLWQWLLSLFSAAVVLGQRRKLRDLLPYAVAVLLTVSAFFLFIMVVPANPFRPQFPVPVDGRGLNPLLLTTSMIFHPVFLYLGFVGFTIPFAFAIGALISGRFGDEWILATRRWTLMAWYFLTVGILIGGWWAYTTLGWGGYWAWDPVENASFMPWLLGTAFLHSVMIQEYRKMLKTWNLTLVIMTFAMTMFGTFLTRSGIISSVHAFSNSSLGAYFLMFIGLLLLFSFAALVYRLDDLRGQAELDAMLSRETTFLANNVILVVITFTIFLGTIFPVLAEAVRGVKVSVGAPFFNKVTVPLAYALLVLMGIGPLIAWRRASWDNLKRNFTYPTMAAGVVAAGGLLWTRNPYALISFGVCAFVTATIVFEFYKGVQARRQLAPGTSVPQALWTLFARNRRRYGGFVVHFGVVVTIIGITVSSNFAIEKEARVMRGELVEVGDYTLRYDGRRAHDEVYRQVVWTDFTVLRDGREVTRLAAGKSFHPNEQQPIAQVGIRSTPWEDLYLILGGVEADGSAATVKVMLNPMVMWIWIGGLIITLGALITIIPSRSVKAPATSGLDLKAPEAVGSLRYSGSR